MVQTFKFSSSSTQFFFGANFSQLKTLVDKKSAIIITDENIAAAHQKKLGGWKVIVLKAGEQYKIQATVDDVIQQLIQLQADRKTTLVGLGGGVITDITGYIASVYMRGIAFGFIPTSILGLVDASIGGKNGIDVGPYKNMVGVIRQPSFILHDAALLKSLPQREWENGFAEVIKHACIKDAAMFAELEKLSLRDYQTKSGFINDLIQRNALIKIKVVQKDEFEKGDRRLLNFGHTLGHAIETQHQFIHGHAISIGMTYACHISEQLTGFHQTERVVKLLENYGLPTYQNFDKQKVFEILKMDKKRVNNEMNFILLNKIGKAVVKPIALKQLEKIVNKL